MKKFNKILALILMVSVVSLIVAGCNGGEGTQSPSGEHPQSEHEHPQSENEHPSGDNSDSHEHPSNEHPK